MNAELMESGTRPVAIVTGASSGIGAATALRLARDGYDVVLTARRKDKLEGWKWAIEEDGGRAAVVDGDISDPATLERVLQEARRMGRIEVLVANAGFGYGGPFEAMRDDEMVKMFEVNVLGVLRSVKAVLTDLRESGRGRIVIVGSVLSRISTRNNAVYCATKHALVGFADALRQELRSSGVRVISVLPGYTATEFFDAMIRREDRPNIEKFKDIWSFHSSEDVAEVISRRIRRPCREVVVGTVNTLVVLLGRVWPSGFEALFAAGSTIAESLAGLSQPQIAAPSRSAEVNP